VIQRILVLGLLVLTAAVLQTALFPALTLGGFRPDLLLLLPLAVGVRDGSASGARVGAVSGLVSDLLISQSPLGLGMLVLAGVGYAVGVVRPYLAPGSFTAPLLLAFVTGMLGTAGFGAFGALLGDDSVTSTLLLQASLAVALYNTLLAPIVLGLVHRLLERFPLRGPAGLD
jgi:rod shape-determining protein MreD